MECVYCAVRTGSLNQTDTVQSLKGFNQSGYKHIYWNTMKCCTNAIFDFDDSKTSDCDFLGYNIFSAENQGVVSV